MNKFIILISRILLFLTGILFIFISLGFLFNSEQAAQNFGIGINNIAGYATVRADMAGYFSVSGVVLCYAVIQKAPQYLWPVLLLIIAALLGRVITIIINGYTIDSFLPMGIEIIIIGLIIFAQKKWIAQSS